MNKIERWQTKRPHGTSYSYCIFWSYGGSEMRKIIYILTPIVIIGLVLLYWGQQWSGKSKDGQWEVVYKNDISLMIYREKYKNTYHGLLFYTGINEDNIEIVSYEFRINGRHACGRKINNEITFPFEFCAYGNKPQKRDILVLILEWKENQKNYREEIKLKPNL